MSENLTLGFKGRYLIEADLIAKTGLHIGGTDEGFEIGGIDNPVIKDPLTGEPYVPGSSLKGKMRSLLEWAEGKVKAENKDGNWTGKVCECGICDICLVFGSSAAEQGKTIKTHINNNKEEEVPAGPSRLIVRDARITEETKEMWRTYLGENMYTELKSENAIDRLTSAANPRSMERVPAESVFRTSFVFDIYYEEDRKRMKTLFQGMQLLEDSYLGGSGTRGSGQVKFANFTIRYRSKDYYTSNPEESPISVEKKDAKEIFEGLEELIKQK